jgi:predicted transcriptional regulator
MKRSNLMDYLNQDKKEDTTTLSVRIDKQLKARVEKLLKKSSEAKRKIGWRSLIEASLHVYVDTCEKQIKR